MLSQVLRLTDFFSLLAGGAKANILDFPRRLCSFSYLVGTGALLFKISRAVDPHSFFSDPDPAVFLNADPDPAASKMKIRIQFKKL